VYLPTDINTRCRLRRTVSSHKNVVAVEQLNDISDSWTGVNQMRYGFDPGGKVLVSVPAMPDPKG